MPLRIAVLLSGNGSTLQNILDRSAEGLLDVEVVCVISSRAGAYGLERAKRAGIHAAAIPRKDHPSAESFGDAVWTELRRYGPGLVVLAGFMSLLPIPPDFRGRIMNVHPALIPAFSGQGMYGLHVHQAVIEYGAKLSGVTVHFVDDEYDRGPVILQVSVPVFEDDTPETLAERVQAEERELYPEAIQLFAEGRLKVEGRRVRILPK
jgi:formyltetrahydrofolate-dependent phosphoribosylglycinamide formyltransferase